MGNDDIKPPWTPAVQPKVLFGPICSPDVPEKHFGNILNAFYRPSTHGVGKIPGTRVAAEHNLHCFVVNDFNPAKVSSFGEFNRFIHGVNRTLVISHTSYAMVQVAGKY